MEKLNELTKLFDNKLINNSIIILIYIVIACTLYFLLKKFIKKFYNKKMKANHKAQYQTVLKMCLSFGKIIIITILFLAILSKIGVNVSKLVAGLGVVSLVIGLALQDLFKDIIAGVSIILDDYFIIGDIVEFAGFKGEVISLGIKSVKIKRYNGEVLIVNNREINKIVNYSKKDTIAPLEFFISLEEKPKKVIETVERALERYEQGQDVVDKPICLGVSNNDKNSYTIRVTFTTVSEHHYEEGRKLRLLILEELQKAKIKQPFERYKNDKI